YPSYEAYCEVKGRIFSAQEKQDMAILNRADPRVWAFRKSLAAQVVSFGWDEVDEGVFAPSGEIVWRGKGSEEKFPLARVNLQGVHNVENLMAVVCAAKAMGIDARFIQQSMESFPGIEHRHEFVREKDGVRFYNDSKGTNVGAVSKSLASFTTPVILLAGGIDKGGDYRVLEQEVREKVKALILFGSAKEIIRRALGHLTQTVVVDDLESAVREAIGHAVSGDTVLLSPACSSFDMFENYEERGRVFKDLVHRL
ncbi:MAG: UDP-N-acetylmuramoyl-L-alanine--D-glutamate ligase, partial [Deltaproteobacteria bacterium]|nr:UDP-N-acetylmuramoyl-L-alanine--D-glutamate ligase [Deltaproteobacteria bacterium]